MASRSLKSFVPTADELLSLDLPRLGGILLAHLKSYEGLNTVYQRAGLNRDYFIAMLERRNVGLGPLPDKEPEYGTRQPEVTQAMVEAWNWLEREGLLIRNPQQSADWFLISREGEKQLQRFAQYEHLEKLGLNRVKGDLMTTGGIRDVGGPQEVRDLAWKWVEMKENQAKANASASELTLIADSRLAELRKLVSSQFDFRKLIRLCEEINTAYGEKCYLATAMLTRGLLDHVPPLFEKNTFSEVANNYRGGGKSFKDTMLHLENAARKVADAHLHMPIRKSETLPAAQQVNFASHLDVLLAEIVRITQ
jgi:hypothetical protein